MTFDWHMLYPLHTVILDKSQVLGVFPAKHNCAIFQSGFSAPVFGVVPIWELWQFCYVRTGPLKPFQPIKKGLFRTKWLFWVPIFAL